MNYPTTGEDRQTALDALEAMHIARNSLEAAGQQLTRAQEAQCVAENDVAAATAGLVAAAGVVLERFPILADIVLERASKLKAQTIDIPSAPGGVRNPEVLRGLGHDV